MVSRPGKEDWERIRQLEREKAEIALRSLRAEAAKQVNLSYVPLTLNSNLFYSGIPMCFPVLLCSVDPNVGALKLADHLYALFAVIAGCIIDVMFMP